MAPSQWPVSAPAESSLLRALANLGRLVVGKHMVFIRPSEQLENSSYILHYFPAQRCPVELAMMVEMFCVCTVRYSGH